MTGYWRLQRGHRGLRALVEAVSEKENTRGVDDVNEAVKSFL